jgi:hypothetical protein
MPDHWRLAFMFDAPGRDLAALEDGLLRATGRIRSLAGGAHVRLGVTYENRDLQGVRGPDEEPKRDVDGALEVTVAAARAPSLPDLARSLCEALDGVVDPASLEVMTGPIFPIVPARDGGAFLSLAFRRYPGTTSEEFRAWWLHQHSAVATPVLGPGLLAYDQVHVDPGASEAVAQAAGVPYVPYDAYDNLTWDDREAFLHSISNDADMARVFADEVGHIDDPSRRHALMRKIA